MFAVIRVRGDVHINEKFQDTLNLINLTRVNHLSLVEEKQRGMLKKVEPYITWGEICKEVFAKLLEKRGKLRGDKKLSESFLKENKLKNFEELAEKILKDRKELKAMGIKLVFRLTPPKKGYERKGIKKSFSVGGVSGYRGKKINELIEKMM